MLAIDGSPYKDKRLCVSRPPSPVLQPIRHLESAVHMHGSGTDDILQASSPPPTSRSTHPSSRATTPPFARQHLQDSGLMDESTIEASGPGRNKGLACVSLRGRRTGVPSAPMVVAGAAADEHMTHPTHFHPPNSFCSAGARFAGERAS